MISCSSFMNSSATFSTHYRSLIKTCIAMSPEPRTTWSSPLSQSRTAVSGPRCRIWGAGSSAPCGGLPCTASRWVKNHSIVSLSRQNWVFLLRDFCGCNRCTWSDTWAWLLRSYQLCDYKDLYILINLFISVQPTQFHAPLTSLTQTRIIESTYSFAFYSIA